MTLARTDCLLFLSSPENNAMAAVGGSTFLEWLKSNIRPDSSSRMMKVLFIVLSRNIFGFTVCR